MYSFFLSKLSSLHYIIYFAADTGLYRSFLLSFFCLQICHTDLPHDILFLPSLLRQHVLRHVDGTIAACACRHNANLFVALSHRLRNVAIFALSYWKLLPRIYVAFVYFVG